MNFLELAKRTSKECGISGEGPSSVAGQSGMNAKVVNWVRKREVISFKNLKQ